MIREDIEVMGPVRVRDVEAAQDEIVMKIRASHILVESKEACENLLLDIEKGVSFEDSKRLFFQFRGAL